MDDFDRHFLVVEEQGGCVAVVGRVLRFVRTLVTGDRTLALGWRGIGYGGKGFAQGPLHAFGFGQAAFALLPKDLALEPCDLTTQIHDLATCRFIEEKVAVLIAGPTGTGKSHLVQALGHAAARQGYDVLFAKQTQLLGSLRSARATGTYERRFQQLVKVPLLICDDFGLKPLRSPEDEDFHDLIAERYERTATVLTSNLDFTEWGEAFASNKMIGAATLDRLRRGAYRVVLDGESYRSLRPTSEKGKPPTSKGRPAQP
jgi:hypothetical protein